MSRFITILLFSVAINSLLAQRVPEETLRDEMPRYTKYTLEEIEQIAKDIDFNPRGTIDEINARLNEFYLSDPSRKKIQQEQDINLDLPFEMRGEKEWNVNLHRLFMKDLLSTPSSSYLIKQAPNIHLMHLTLARAYLNRKKPYQAAFHYSMSIRYRSVKLDPTIYYDEDRLQLLEKDNPQKEQAKQYKELKTKLVKEQAEIDRLKEQVIVLQDKQVAPFEPDTSTGADPVEEQRKKNRKLIEDQLRRNRELLARFKSQHEETKKQFEQAEKVYEDTAREYNRKSSVILTEVADLIREIEDAIKERQKVLNKKTLYKTSFNQTLLHDYSQNRQFTAFANVLEMASRLDPENPVLPKRLGDEYRTARQTRRAIFAYNKAVEANKKAPDDKKLKKEEEGRIYLALGSLFNTNRRYVDAAANYEQAYSRLEDSEAKKNLQYQLAKLHVERTGNYDRAEELFSSYLQELENLNPTRKDQRSNWLKTRFHIYKYLAFIKDKKRNYKEMQTTLQKAIDVYQGLQTMITEQHKEISDTFKKMQEAKQPLLNDTRESDLGLFYRLRGEYKNKKDFLDRLNAIRNSLPLRNVYFSLGNYLEREHDLRGAIEVYQEAEKLGIAPDEARRHLSRLRNR